MDFLFSYETIIVFLSLTFLELVLGIDNIVFIIIITSKLPEKWRKHIRRFGLALAMGARIALLFFLSYLIGLTKPLFFILSHGVSARDVILFLGGLFLLWNAIKECLALSADYSQKKEATAPDTLAVSQVTRWALITILFKIVCLDIVFSLDSVLTAIALADHIEIMIAAVVCSVVLMMLLAEPLAKLIEKYVAIKFLGLMFLILIGLLLVVEGSGFSLEKSYVYAILVFGLVYEGMRYYFITRHTQ